MAEYNELSDIQLRLLIDLRQAGDAWWTCRRELRSRYAGTMRWRTQAGRQYLVRKIRRVERSLGPRTPETERQYAAFQAGRDACRQRDQALSRQVAELARQASALGLGQVPPVVARLLAELNVADFDQRVRVIGTHALFAYENLLGVRFFSGITATRDIDFLIDPRAPLELALVNNEENGVLLNLIRRVDRTFDLDPKRPYRLVNGRGFMIDIIRPVPSPPWKPWPVSDALEGIAPAEIEGLQWMINCPKIESIMLDLKGYPVAVHVPDPRWWLAHKKWLAQRADREALRRRRDQEQARALEQALAAQPDAWPLDDAFLSSLPAQLQTVWSR